MGDFVTIKLPVDVLQALLDHAQDTILPQGTQTALLRSVHDQRHIIERQRSSSATLLEDQSSERHISSTGYSFTRESTAISTTDTERFAASFAPSPHLSDFCPLPDQACKGQKRTHSSEDPVVDSQACPPKKKAAMGGVNDNGNPWLDVEQEGASHGSPEEEVHDEEEGEEGTRRGRSLRRRQVGDGGGDGGGGGGGQGMAQPRRLSKKRKNRKRAKRRENQREHAEARESEVEGEDEGGEDGPQTSRRIHHDWRIASAAPEPTEDCRLELEHLCSPLNNAQTDILMTLLTQASANALQHASHDALDVSLACTIKSLNGDKALVGLHLAMAYMQLTLLIDAEDRVARASSKGPSRCAKSIGRGACRKEQAKRLGICATTLSSWIANGTRLLYLAIAGSPMVLPILAVQGHLAKIYGKTVTVGEVMTMGAILHNPEDTPMGREVKRHYRPLAAQVYDKWKSSNCTPSLYVPSEKRRVPLTEWEVWDSLRKVLHLNAYALPDLDERWLERPLDAKFSSFEQQVCLPVPRVIQTEFQVGADSCPVTPATKIAWTAQARCDVQDNMYTPRDIDDLEYTLSNKYSAGDDSLGSLVEGAYVVVDPSVLKGVPLHLKGRDIKEQKEALLALLVPKEAAAPPGLSSPFLQLLDSILDRLKTLYPKDLHYDESTGTLYSGFVAIHYTWYNRYSEKGDKDLPGPDKAYATRIVRGEAGKSNPYQRIPRESQEIREDPAGYQAMCEMLQPLFEWIRTSMAQYLPNEEYELRAYVEDLPLHSDSPCAPFGGYVVNFCVCTLAHRDHGDKILCVVCPMGQWEGGELVLYEAGLILALRPGDLVFFPSNKVTHFNMDFRGERVSFVMHSDVTGDAWVEERNGWGAHVQ